jgi:hypothetical protein
MISEKIMVNLAEKPEQFKAQLKDKWLDYYEANRSWLQASMDVDRDWYDSVEYEEEELEQLGFNDYSPRRPNYGFILGVLNILEPQLKGLFTLSPGCPQNYIQRLGLDFDPEIELKKRG